MSAVPRETLERLTKLEALIRAESKRQNLVAQSTLVDFQNRHIRDCLQLVARLGRGPVLDIGSGAGLPGLVIAIAEPAPVTLVEPRRLRAEFLAFAARELALGNVEIICAKVEQLRCPAFGSITARAVMSLDRLFGAAIHLADLSTRWVLPKGRSAETELAAARRSWQGRFELVLSATDPEAAIVVADAVRMREA